VRIRRELEEGPIAEQHVRRAKSRIWGNHGLAVLMSGAGSVTRRRAEWQEHQSLARKGQHKLHNTRHCFGENSGTLTRLRAISSFVRGSLTSEVVLRGYCSKRGRTLSKSASNSTLSACTVSAFSDVRSSVV